MNVDRALQEAEEPKNKGRYKCSRVFGCLGRMFSFPLLAVLLWFWFVPVAVAGCSPTNSTSDPTAINSPSLPTSLLDLQFGLSLNGSRGVGGQSNGSEVAALGCDKFASFAAAVGTAPWPGNNLSFGASWQFTGDGWFDPSWIGNSSGDFGDAVLVIRSHPPCWGWLILGASGFFGAGLFGGFVKSKYKKRKKRRQQQKHRFLRKKTFSQADGSRKRCFQTCRWAGCMRQPHARLKNRRIARTLRARRLFFWLQGKHFAKTGWLQNEMRRKFCGSVREGSFASQANVVQKAFQRPHVSRLVMFRGGAAGAAATKRRRQESFLVDGLKKLLSSLNDFNDDNESPQHRGRPSVRQETTYRDVSPASSLSNRSRSPSPEWQVKGKKNKGAKGSGLGKAPSASSASNAGGKGKGPAPLSSQRKVHFEENGQTKDSSLIAQLKAIVLAAETHGTGDLINQLRALVQRWSEAEIKTPSQPTGRPKNAQPKSHASPRGPKSNSWPTVCKNWWKGDIARPTQVSNALESGEEPSGSLVVSSIEQCLNFRILAEAHKITKEFCLVCADLTDATLAAKHGCVAQWIKLQTGRWKQVWALPLNKNFPTWPVTPKSVSCVEDPVEVPLVTVRVTFSKQFLSSSMWDLALQKPVEVLKLCLPDGIFLRTYGWHYIQKEEVVMGFIRTSEENAVTIVKKSGAKHAFYATVGDKPARQPVKWLAKEQNMTNAQYLAQARKEARDVDAGIALRKGTKSCLGIIGVQDQNSSQELLVKRWAARGVPANWIPSQFEDTLTKHGWRVLSDAQPPNNKGGIWTYKGAPPKDSTEAGMILCLKNGKQILINPWVAKTKKPVCTPLHARKSWLTVVAGTNDSKDKEQDEPMAPTIPDPPEDGAEATEGGAMDDVGKTGKRNTDERQVINTPPKHKVPKTVPGGFDALDDSSALGPSNVPMWDLGGAGDCGFRALSAQVAFRNKMELPEIERKITKLSLSLRAKACAQLSSQDGWKASWFNDPEATVQTEAGAVAETVEEFLKVIQREKKWLDPWLTQACAEVLQTEVMVWKYRTLQSKWIFLTRSRPQYIRNSVPLVLFLKDGHFTTLPSNVTFPDEWQELGLDEEEKQANLSFIGGGKSSGSGQANLNCRVIKRISSEEKSVKSSSSNVSKWLKPPPPASESSGVSKWLRPPEDVRSAASSKVSQWLKPCSNKSVKSGKGKKLSSGAAATCSGDQKKGVAGKIQSFPRVTGHTWVCPVCHITFQDDTTNGLSCKKLRHLKSRHPEFDVNLVKRTKATVFQTSSLLPKHERDWECPICKEGLPCLPYKARIRAIREHCKRHPGENPKSLADKNSCGKPKLAVQKARTDAWAQFRKKKFRTHTVVQVPTLDYKQNIDRIPNLYYCKKCLAPTSRAMVTVRTCKQMLRAYKDQPQVVLGRRVWWGNMKSRSPKHMHAFLAATGWTMDEVDQLFQVKKSKNQPQVSE